MRILMGNHFFVQTFSGLLCCLKVVLNRWVINVCKRKKRKDLVHTTTIYPVLTKRKAEHYLE